MLAPPFPMTPLTASDVHVTFSVTSFALRSASVANIERACARPSSTLSSDPVIVSTFVVRFKLNLAPVVSCIIVMVAPPFPMRISGSLPASTVTETSPAASTTGSSDAKAAASASSAALFGFDFLVPTSCHSSTTGTVSHCNGTTTAGVDGALPSSAAFFFFLLRLRFFFSPVTAAAAVAAAGVTSLRTDAPFFFAAAALAAAASLSARAASAAAMSAANASSAAAASFAFCSFSAAACCFFRRSLSLLAAARLAASLAPLRLSDD
mmetsp:Transcript_7479/g.12541  ORF Transcript_7479/g.12541 Transcript_7479/m.12541 type:complete len:266 (+) Transcript_7479:322-1119(+)